MYAFLLPFLVSLVGAVPYKQYILAPSSRTIRRESVYLTNGTASGAPSLLSSSLSRPLMLSPKSGVTYDFGKNIAGLAKLKGSSSTAAYVNITFSESSLLGSPLQFLLNGAGEYTSPRDKERGGFRYLSVVAPESGKTVIDNDELRKYTGWFHCSDDQLNRVWYAGAYTNQLYTIDPTHGDALIHLHKINSDTIINETTSWYSNHAITNGTSAITDGAKCDRLVWAGDMAIAVPALAVSASDYISVKNSLDSLFTLQSPEGILPCAGVPFSNLGAISFTYHLYTLIGGMTWITKQIDHTGLANVTAAPDWLRFGMGGHNVEANSILYHILALGISLAETLHDTSVIHEYKSYRQGIASAANTLLWNPSTNLFRQRDHNLPPPRWQRLGDKSRPYPALPLTPHFRGTRRQMDAISPFTSRFELEAHFLSNQIVLIRKMWGDFMLDDPRMINSTFLEGYSVAGELHYASYVNNPRISHAHGWATGPTSTMTTFIAGLQLVGPAGKTWIFAPQLGNLEHAEAGVETVLGLFSLMWRWAGFASAGLCARGDEWEGWDADWW
ncbi:Six-hairpin glycosidase [Choiromyces venosus 120613-1]|uniref:Six-hairpin glycosidase n=1 Tax=Choiromyces venosus 120613-1 TaxID=1336337 RepID=A0A3N4J8U3_9PEZI|nr:Six-hairpin glycosidase [Choiromyces venosus 120613-1]